MPEIPPPRYGQVDRDYAARLATTPADEDGPVWMINLMHYRDRADYGDGSTSGISGREADDRYAPLGPLAAIGAEIVFVADVDAQLLGDAPEVGPGRDREVPDPAVVHRDAAPRRTSRRSTSTRTPAWPRPS